jgi:peptide/nickel transport system ATP-binding protein
LQVAGHVSILGDLQRADDQRARRQYWGRTLTLLPQEPWTALDPTMRARSQVAEVYERVRRMAGGTRAARSRAGEDFAALHLADAPRAFPFMLSGGMAQRVAFAAARAGGASVLVADEPTKGLDADRRDGIVSMLRSHLEHHGTLLTITHDVSIARALGGTIAVMLDGRIVEQDTADRLLAAPQHPYTRRLLAAEPSAWPSRPPRPGGNVILSATGIAKAFGHHRLFSNLDIEVRAGDLTAITGPSGSGKTTLGGVLLGLVAADEGVIVRPPQMPAWKYQKLYQDPVASFAPRATLRTLLEDVVERHGREWAAVDHLLRRVRLAANLLDRRPDQVSGGELQRFALVRVLMIDPVVVFADEPTSRLDPITQQETLELLVETAADRGCALILVTHDQVIAEKLGARIVSLGDLGARP